jgi:hypothetical protein
MLKEEPYYLVGEEIKRIEWKKARSLR